jgi:membrane-associated phospholipid phosphatase
MSIAIATLIWGYKIRSLHPKQGKGLIYFWYFLVLCALVMGLCRIITVVHRPSDILGGYILWATVPLLSASPYIFPYLKKRLITPIVRLQEWLFSLISN